MSLDARYGTVRRVFLCVEDRVLPLREDDVSGGMARLRWQVTYVKAVT